VLLVHVFEPVIDVFELASEQVILVLDVLDHLRSEVALFSDLVQDVLDVLGVHVVLLEDLVFVVFPSLVVKGFDLVQA
jgi:hypothetical protein